MSPKAKSPTKEEILNDPEVKKDIGSNMTKLFFAETPEAVNAYVKAGLKINHQDVAEDTPLDWCIDRIVRNINTYEDSDNKGAALTMINHGAKCHKSSLEELQEANPDFFETVKKARIAYAAKEQKLTNAIFQKY